MSAPDLVASATTFASNRRMDRQLRQAYGERWPGSYRRWLDQEAEREWHARAERMRRARALWERVHGTKPAA